ncbi:L,D-transpeptidase family protein [Luteolibacter pohnpeiensis]|uniref:L,D-transpeptidase family protein n=1 Tax=Luteolibacter pohnpeiensis TaxID=454153 RepID=A0A934S4Q3_9BACT|nr:L,D-transpeptidase family protein [Luteolibacter pohnpeiensis]MBK1881863.1 L,D-transpeptidase family protein [Luteolibacter pohnpeiensis]
MLKWIAPLCLALASASSAFAENASASKAPTPPLPQTKQAEVLSAQPLDESTADTPIKPAAPLVPANAKPEGDAAVQLQIFLDQSHFGPGIIDGRPGRFTELAVRSWNEANGVALDDWTAVTAAARKSVPNAFAVAVVPDAIKDWVNPNLPSSRAEQAKLKRMSYTSNAEFMAERYHCDVPYLIQLNSSSKINNLKSHDSIIVPNVEPFQIELVTGKSYPADPTLNQRHVVVDTKVNQVRIFEAAPAALIVAEPGASGQADIRPNHGLIASFPITPGQDKFLKFGTWELKNMIEMPYWRYDQQFLETGKRGSEALNIPPGPNSPVGIIWCGTSRSGIGMHGTSNPETIGRARSAGCIRLANWDAIRLPTIVRPGVTVEIR